MSDSSQATAFLEKNTYSVQVDATGSVSRPTCASPVDIVISDENLDDVPVSVFLYGLAQHPVLSSHPILVLTGTTESARRLRSAGVYLLERPYSVQGLTRMLQKAMSSMRRNLKADVFEAAAQLRGVPLQPRQKKQKIKPAAPSTTSDWYKKGMACLLHNHLREAEYAFIHVLERQEDHSDAALGLARIYHAKGDNKAMCRYLLRAAATSLREGNKIRAAHIAGMLPAKLRDNIYFYEAFFRMEEGDYKAAALGFLDAAKENSDISLHHIISRACLLTSEPEIYMRRICVALAGMGYKATADRLRRRLLVYPEVTSEEAHSWLDAYPRIKDAINVASYTAWAWKYA
ncbi:MAG: hypothetical protein LBD42_07410 [Desulfovibrio sp.]|jgi:hypothetical protein|nr:hypothetical protein [Desulfovibrio sp.]